MAVHLVPPVFRVTDRPGPASAAVHHRDELASPADIQVAFYEAARELSEARARRRGRDDRDTGLLIAAVRGRMDFLLDQLLTIGGPR